MVVQVEVVLEDFVVLRVVEQVILLQQVHLKEILEEMVQVLLYMVLAVEVVVAAVEVMVQILVLEVQVVLAYQLQSQVHL